jgi:Ca2+-binding EF-hand superfamily protein
MNPRLLTFIFLVLPCALLSQTASRFKISTNRMLFHDLVDKQQKLLLNANDSLKLSDDESVNLQVADVLLRQVDEMQEKIEEDTITNGQEKVRLLKSLENLLIGYNRNKNRKDYPVSIAPALLKAYNECLALDKKGQSIESVIAKNEYGVGKIVVECFVYPTENAGVKPSRLLLIRKYLETHPDEILPELNKNPNVPFADKFIQMAAHRDIRKLYDYAAARNTLGNKIRNHPDSLVRMIGTIAASKSGQLYFPFLDNLMRKTITLKDIDSVKDNDLEYFRLMVRTRIEYAHRLLPPFRDSVMGMKALTDRMATKAKQYFIREINSLHTVENESIRYKRLDGLSPQELYYLVVMGEDEIYTSSYLNVYKKIFQRMAVPRSDSLLLSVNGDYFRKFIKMAAGYNTLNDFLGKMDKDNATTTMKAFVIRLESTEDLEQAVDVADSYSSIMDKNPNLAGFISQEVKWNLDRNIAGSNKRGIVIYNLLKVLFESADTTKKIDLSKQLGITSIYGQDYNSLVDDSGRVIQQVFFYGDEDKDGQLSYENFMKMFRGKPEWKVETNDDWSTITSIKGQRIMIFANRPLLGPDDPDARAQAKLNNYLADYNLKPTIVIHRGHSYHLQYTLKQLAPSAKIVVLGSCGGYNNLNEVLTICDDAQIISTKQVGTKTVNEPILQAINAELLNGKNIDWITMWRGLSTRFKDAASREKFEDYIPPYKNLGAIFIKSYRKTMGE